MPGGLEREGGVSHLPEESPRKSRKKEAPQFSVLERICSGVEVVECTGGKRKYRVVWGEKTLGVPRQCFFTTAQRVLDQHERVVGRYLGTAIPLAVKQVVTIPGEIQQMNKLAVDLTQLRSLYENPFARESLPYFQAEIGFLQREIGQVRNPFKLRAQRELRVAEATPQVREQAQKVLEANLAILRRTEECLGIVGGTTARFEYVSNRRDRWEGLISAAYSDLAKAFDDLDKGKTTGFQFVAASKYSRFRQLQTISGPEYWRRIQSPDVKNLANFDAAVQNGDIKRAKRILQAAILKLKRVVQQRQERQKAKTAEKR